MNIKTETLGNQEYTIKTYTISIETHNGNSNIYNFISRVNNELFSGVW